MTTTFAHLRRSSLLSASVIILSSLSACQTFEGLKRDLSGNNSATQDAKPSDPYVRVEGARLEEDSIGYGLDRGPKRVYNTAPTPNFSAREQRYTTTQPTDFGQVPSISTPQLGDADSVNRTAPTSKVGTIDAYVAPLPLPQFVDIVFGEMLQVPFVMGKDVAAMTEVVQLRSSGKIPAESFQTLVSEALKEYGVRVIPENGSYKVLQDQALRSRRPRYIKSRARVSTRADLRPIIQFVELQAVESNSMLPILQAAFKDKAGSINITSTPSNNFITLSGLPEDVNAALSIINELDELTYAGSQINKYTPQFWNVDEFSTVLEDALKVEGWEVTSVPNFSRTIYLFPVEFSNDLFIFAKTAQAHERVRHWLTELDRPIQGGDAKQIYIYQVKNVAAEELAETANSVLSGGGPSNLSGISTPSGAQAGELNQPRGFGGGNGGGLTSSQTRFTVDPSGNRIVFTGTSNDYTKLLSLLEQLDTPAPEVLIEVQIAEVSLTNNTNIGVDFSLTDIGLGNVSANASTQGGLGVGSNGLLVGLLGNDIDATLNAFANNRRVKILSTPVLTARSGSQAEIQVGQDIPVLSSQAASPVQNIGGQTEILQSIEYRSTGVLMSIEPIVFSDNRIDLTISQEVSSELDTPNSTISSPTISSRTLSTQLSLEDGETAVMGGLIQRSFTIDEQGVPFLKDIPLIGQLFSNNGVTADDTELVVLITAYVLRGQSDKDKFVNRLSGRIDGLLANDDRLYTLKPLHF